MKAFCGKRDIESLLGPLVQDFHRVTPAAVVRCSKLLELLMDAGVSNGVLYPSRFETAVKSSMVPSAPGKSHDLWASEITDHIRLCFGMIRQMRMDEALLNGRIRSRKSSAFKRLCGAADLIVIGALVRKITLSEDSVEGDAVSVGPAPISDGTAIPRGDDIMEDIFEEINFPPDLSSAPSSGTDDMNEFKLLFKSGAHVGKEMDSLLGDECFSEVPSTVLYPESFDQDGFPIIASARSSRASTPRSATPTPKTSAFTSPAADAADSIFEPVDPCSRRRKAVTLQKRAQDTPKKMKASSKVVAEQPSSKKMPKATVAAAAADDSSALHRGRLATTKDGRCEVTAYTKSCNKRIHVTTVLERVYGAEAKQHMALLVQKINEEGYSKERCLQLKLGLAKES